MRSVKQVYANAHHSLLLPWNLILDPQHKDKTEIVKRLDWRQEEGLWDNVSRSRQCVLPRPDVTLPFKKTDQLLFYLSSHHSTVVTNKPTEPSHVSQIPEIQITLSWTSEGGIQKEKASTQHDTDTKEWVIESLVLEFLTWLLSNWLTCLGCLVRPGLGGNEVKLDSLEDWLFDTKSTKEPRGFVVVEIEGNDQAQPTLPEYHHRQIVKYHEE